MTSHHDTVPLRRDDEGDHERTYAMSKQSRCIASRSGIIIEGGGMHGVTALRFENTFG